MSVYGYIRVSTSLQQLSIEAQGERLYSYCDYRELHLDKIFTDEDVSGGKPILGRPAGSALCEKVKKNDQVIAVKLDRCFRDAADGIATLFWWQSQGVTLHLADDGMIADTKTATGFLTVSMQLVIGQYERMVTSERTSHALLSAQANGKRVSRSVPYGYMPDTSSKFDPETGLYEKMKACPAERENLKLIHALAQRGLGCSQIAREMTQAGTTQRNGRDWSRQTIWKIVAKRA